MNSNIQHIYIRHITPVARSRAISASSGRSGTLTQPRYFDIPTCQCPQQLFYQTVKLLQCWMVLIRGCTEREKSPKGKNHCKLLKIIRNDWKSSQMSGN